MESTHKICGVPTPYLSQLSHQIAVSVREEDLRDHQHLVIRPVLQKVEQLFGRDRLAEVELGEVDSSEEDSGSLADHR